MYRSSATILVLAFAAGLTQAGGKGAEWGSYQNLTKLSGDWVLSAQDRQEGKATQHKLVAPMIGTDATAMRFQVIGKGSTVQENLLPGTAKEMATMYHCDKFADCSEVKATHYCAKKNQPQLVLGAKSNENTVVLNCDMNTPLCNSNEGHVHKITHELSEKGDHLKTTYTIYEGGKFQKNSTYHFDRKTGS